MPLSKETIIICPTLKRATYEWQKVRRKFPNLIKEAKRDKLSIEFINGNIWFFYINNQKLIGYHGADIVHYDEFLTSEEFNIGGAE